MLPSALTSSGSGGAIRSESGDAVRAWLNSIKCEPMQPEQQMSSLMDAAEAVECFRSLSEELDAEELRDAFIHSVVGRGFPPARSGRKSVHDIESANTRDDRSDDISVIDPLVKSPRLDLQRIKEMHYSLSVPVWCWARAMIFPAG